MKEDILAYIDTISGKEFYGNSKVFVLVDENTKKYCLSVFEALHGNSPDFFVMQIKSGEKNKNIDSIVKIWDFLIKHKAERNDVFINLGGGVICDIGAFAASTYKRGISFINVPTTLLAMVDAAIGGKNGINFNDLKNVIGTFNIDFDTILHYDFLKTLPQKEMLSGYAEMLKVALVADNSYWRRLKSSSEITSALVETAIVIKQKIVAHDPFEKDIRKMLNFGHTFGHAFESLAIHQKKRLSHGEAVIMGIACELFLSAKYAGLSIETKNEIEKFLLDHFRLFKIKETDFSFIYTAIIQDKKNKANKIYPVFLKKIGQPVYDMAITKKDITESLNYYINLGKQQRDVQHTTTFKKN